MSRPTFETSEALVYDPVPMNRNATRTALSALGFRRIAALGSVEAFSGHMSKHPPDIALCEVQPDKDVCEAIQAVRQGLSGHNPFVVIIATAWDNSNGLVGRVLQSGADDLLLRPFSATTLGSRIRTHAERRKSFVIRTDYVGPDRSRSPHPKPGVFVPPNSLQMKARDNLSADLVAIRLEAELKAAREVLHSEKLRRDAFQVCVLWRLIQSRPPASRTAISDLGKLRTLTLSVEHRCSELGLGQAVEWCQSIGAALEGIEFGVDRNAALHLLGHAALSLNQMFSPDKSTGEHLTHIDATVAILNARSQASLSA